jgi:hypothetical protein
MEPTHGDRLFAMYGACNVWMERVGLPDQSVGANDRHAPADDEADEPTEVPCVRS